MEASTNNSANRPDTTVIFGGLKLDTNEKFYREVRNCLKMMFHSRHFKAEATD